MSKLYKSFKVSLAATAGAGGIATIPNPEGVDVYITRAIVNLTHTGAALSSLDAGTSSTIASSDNLLDGLDVGTTAACFDNIKNPGTNGKAGQIWRSDAYVTLTGSGGLTGLAGDIFVEYTRLS